MKKLARILTVLMLASMLLAALPLSVFAAEVYYVNGTVGEPLYYLFFNDEYDIVEYTECSSRIPGVDIIIPGDGKVAISGTPTSEGHYVMEISVYTQRAGCTNIVLDVTIVEELKIPVVTKNPVSEKVVEGESATFIARATDVSWYEWHIAIGEADLSCDELASYFGGNVSASCPDGETLVIYNIPTGLNGAYIWCKFVGQNGSVSSDAARLTVIRKEDATPEITKHPTDETVEEGGEAVFVAKAKYARYYLWQLVSPDGMVFDCGTAHLTFPQLKVDGEETERLKLSNIPLELDGYKIQCMFTAGDTVVSNRAALYVTEKPTEPTEESTEPPTEEPTAAPTEAPAKPPKEEPTEASRENSDGKDFSDKINSNNRKDEDEEKGGSNTLLIVLIAAVAVVAVAGIGSFTVLKLKKSI